MSSTSGRKLKARRRGGLMPPRSLWGVALNTIRRRPAAAPLVAGDEKVPCREIAVAGFIDVALLGPQKVVEPDASIEHHKQVLAGEYHKGTRGLVLRKGV